jgi:hypothetical protein
VRGQLVIADAEIAQLLAHLHGETKVLILAVLRVRYRPVPGLQVGRQRRFLLHLVLAIDLSCVTPFEQRLEPLEAGLVSLFGPAALRKALIGPFSALRALLTASAFLPVSFGFRRLDLYGSTVANLRREILVRITMLDLLRVA